MELSGIEQFLERYRKQLFDAEDKRTVIRNTIAGVSGITLSEKDITIKKDLVEVHADSVTRHQLFLYKQKIIDTLKDRGVKGIFDIR